MAKFHIGKSGKAAACSAKKGNCPYGSDDEHFSTREEAQKEAENRMSQNNSITKSAKKPSIENKNPFSSIENNINEDGNLIFKGRQYYQNLIINNEQNSTDNENYSYLYDTDLYEREKQNRIENALSDIPEKKKYVDPVPGLKGTDKVWRNCWKCEGSGKYYGVNYQSGNRVSLGECYSCNGQGGKHILASSIRAAEKKSIKQHNDNIDNKINNIEKKVVQTLENEKQNIREENKQEVSRQIEQAMIEDLSKVYPMGEKVKDKNVKITRISEYQVDDMYDYYGGTKTMRAINFDTGDGYDFVWHTSSDKAWEVEEGEQMKIGGTVKNVGAFKGTPNVSLKNVRMKK